MVGRFVMKWNVNEMNIEQSIAAVNNIIIVNNGDFSMPIVSRISVMDMATTLTGYTRFLQFFFNIYLGRKYLTG